MHGDDDEEGEAQRRVRHRGGGVPLSRDGTMNGVRVKVEPLDLSSRSAQRRRENGTSEDHQHAEDKISQTVAERRSLRARYRAFKDDFAVRKDDIKQLDSEKFDRVISKVDHLHNSVKRPREQIADAEALLDITSTLVESIKDARRSAINPADFVTGVIQTFTRMRGPGNMDNGEIASSIDWSALGLHACAIFSHAPGLSTMLGPMESQLKPRKVAAPRRPCDRQTETVRPQQVDGSGDGTENIETNKNMEVMFKILRRFKSVQLEALVLNRNSFSQTVENIFALSFLVKDGRAKISIENGQHIVVPKNFPTPQQRESGEGTMAQFVYRLDYKDWQLMCGVVEEGKVLMPHRLSTFATQEGSRTPVRKNCRNRAKETPGAGSQMQDGLQDEDGEVQPSLLKRKRTVN